MEATANYPWEASAEAQRVWGSILSQSATGELIGMMNFASLVDLYEDAEDKIDALEHALIEKGHARAFQRLGQEMGVGVTVNLNAPYWKRIRSAFLKSAGRGDFTACLVIQELMLESFAVSMYGAVGRVAPGRLGKAYKAIAVEETEHLEHAIRLLQEIFDRDPSGLERKVADVHEDVMSVLAEMVARVDTRGDCELCGKTCIKPSLPEASLDIVQLRGGALNLYLKSLDRVGSGLSSRGDAPGTRGAIRVVLPRPRQHLAQPGGRNLGYRPEARIRSRALFQRRRALRWAHRRASAGDRGVTARGERTD